MDILLGQDIALANERLDNGYPALAAWAREEMLGLLLSAGFIDSLVEDNPDSRPWGKTTSAILNL